MSTACDAVLLDGACFIVESSVCPYPAHSFAGVHSAHQYHECKLPYAGKDCV